MPRPALVALLLAAALAGAGAQALLEDDPPADAGPARGAATTNGHESTLTCRDRAMSRGTYSSAIYGGTIRCFGLPRRLVPAGARTRVYELDARTYLLVFDLNKQAGYRVWQRRDSRWQRLFERKIWTGPELEVTLSDVTQDQRSDVLLQGVSGSGGCGPRDLLSIERERVVALLLHDHECEVMSELTADGLLLFREIIGPCPEPTGPRAHCYGGVRTTIRAWSGRRLTTDRRIVRCVARGLDPKRNCRRA